MAAGIATLDVYRDQNLFQRAEELAPYFEEGIHSLKGLPNVIDIRNCGLMGAVEVQPIPGQPTKRATDVFDRCFEKGLFLRAAGSTVVMSPPLIFERQHVDRLVNTLHDAIVESSKHLS
jgi:beta-alanine--pyruvate transaminase